MSIFYHSPTDIQVPNSESESTVLEWVRSLSIMLIHLLFYIFSNYIAV
jgi:hypothetical protein